MERRGTTLKHAMKERDGLGIPVAVCGLKQTMLSVDEELVDLLTFLGAEQARRCATCDAEREQAPKFDPVSRPAHYNQGKVECIDAIEAATTGLTGIEAYCTGQVIKYIWRWKYKNGVEDLEKCAWYLDRLIKHLKKEKTP